MIPGPSDPSRKLITQLIFALLSAMFVVMTAIGGATASHMVTQNDDILKQLSEIRSDLSAEHEANRDMERRIQLLEEQIRKPVQR